VPSEVLLFLGPVRCGKTGELLRQYRSAVRAAAPAAIGRTLWIAPNERAAASVRRQIVTDGLDACLSPGVTTFDRLPNLILSSREAGPPVGISAALTRELLRRVITTLAGRGQLTHYGDAARRNGFVDLVTKHIRELKRQRIDPIAYSKAATRHERAAEHGELALIYTEYQRQLDSHALCDSAGRHTIACAALVNDDCPRLDGLELVVVDGFSDFTLAQHELLRRLAQRAKVLMFTLPCDATEMVASADESYVDLREPLQSRRDLFAKTSATVAQLKYFHPNLQIRELPWRCGSWPVVDHFVRHLFRNPRHVPPLPRAAIPSLHQVEVIEAAGPHDEIVQIALHIKSRILEHKASPGDVAVVFRTLSEAAPRIREVFAHYGIPYSLEAGVPLATNAVVRTLLSILRLDDEDWPFRRLMSVLTNNMLTAIDDEARRAADWLVRDLQIAKGRDALMSRVEQLATVDEKNSPPLSEHAERRVHNAKLAVPAFELLAAAFGELPKQATPMEWISALEQFGKDLGLESHFESLDDSPAIDSSAPLPDQEPRLHRAAWQIIAQHLAALERLDAALNGAPRSLSRRDLLHVLVDLAGHESLPQSTDDAGRIRVLSAATARTISARHLYLGGMTEQSFPTPERAGQLATTADYRFFAGVADQQYATAGPPAVNRPQEEMLLFYEVLTRAEESITISYPALDDKAQVLPPSPYITELLRSLGDCAKEVKRSEPRLSPVPSTIEPPASASDWRILAIAQATGAERDLRLLAGILQTSDSKPLGAALEAGLRITHARQRRDEFGPAEGLITSPAAATRLAERFGAKHLWSPSQWEQYAACPYQFYLQSVLKLEPLGDLVLETDHRRRGSLLHHVLATFHRQFGTEPAKAWDALWEDQARFLEGMRHTLQTAIDESPRHGIDAALLELDRRQIEKWTGGYLDQHEKYSAAWTEFDEPPRPAHFELRFGPRRQGDDAPEDPRSIDTAFPLDIGGETILVAGRIDRIDIGRIGGRTVFNVIDYKSGRRPTLSTDKLESGERLQPAIYVMAAEMLIFGDEEATPLWAGYWSMQNGTTTDARFSLRCAVDSGQPHKKWIELRPKIIKRIGQFVTDIRQGRFPVASRDPDCTSRCEFNTVCRVAQVRSLGKMWLPEGMTSVT
jgi:ATP-dependent helicase/nuclease subunit B